MTYILTGITYVGTYLLGIGTGVLVNYCGNQLTDRRRQREQQREKRAQFARVVDKMPELIDEMREDLARSPLIREFFVVGKESTLNARGEYFRYAPEDDPDLVEKVKILENHGFIIDIREGYSRLYRMTEPFVEMVVASKSKGRRWRRGRQRVEST